MTVYKIIDGIWINKRHVIRTNQPYQKIGTNANDNAVKLLMEETRNE